MVDHRPSTCASPAAQDPHTASPVRSPRARPAETTEVRLSNERPSSSSVDEGAVRRRGRAPAREHGRAYGPAVGIPGGPDGSRTSRPVRSLQSGASPATPGRGAEGQGPIREDLPVRTASTPTSRDHRPLGVATSHHPQPRPVAPSNRRDLVRRPPLSTAIRDPDAGGRVPGRARYAANGQAQIVPPTAAPDHRRVCGSVQRKVDVRRSA